ncbi:MAG: Rab family GTPase [Promethearchaeota archaeon]
MSSELIHSIVYTEFDDTIGPNPLFYLPTELPENIRMLVGIKTITILSADHGFIPDSLIIIPFPSIRLKGIIKYMERHDSSRRGNVAQSAITFLFKEIEDIIFYKYIDYLDAPFNEAARIISELQSQNAPYERIFEEIKHLRDNICTLLVKLRAKESMQTSAKPFPEISTKEEKIAEIKIKIAVCGDPGVGKTSTILRFTDNAFSRRYLPTMGVSISEKLFSVKERIVELIIWDIAGQTKFQKMRRHFYQGSEAVVLVFDLTNPISFSSIRDWEADIQKNLFNENKKNMIGYLFGNKSDMIDERKISNDDAMQLASELNLIYVETSAMTGKNVESAFFFMTEKILESRTSRMDN